MGRLVKVCLLCFGAIALVPIAGVAWLYFNSSGLPDTDSLGKFAPATMAQVTDPCQKSSSVAIPYESIGDNLRDALGAAEGGEDGPGVLLRAVEGFHSLNRPRSTLSMRVSRSICYTPSRNLIRELNQIRVAVQLERHFSRRELFTIFANRTYFGENTFGVEAASRHYFSKEPNQLQIGEAALLAGMVKSPSIFSPTKHTDRALRRRNEVIDAMVQAKSISEVSAIDAKSSPLGLAIQEN
jgi:penicillin-binding protein 1A